MKWIFCILAFATFTACSSTKHDHHHHDGAHHADGAHDCGCAKTAEGKEHNCKEGCAHHAKDHKCAGDCAHNANKDWNITGMTKEEFSAAFAKKSEKLGKKCAAAAQEYCGKQTKDLSITEDEASCLLAKTQRVTREVLPALDKTECEKALKRMGKSKKK